MRAVLTKAVAGCAAMGAMGCGARTGLLDDDLRAGVRDAGADVTVRDVVVDVLESAAPADVLETAAPVEACPFSCGGQCTDPQSDEANCGACDNACPADQSCVAGACRLSCDGGLTDCVVGGTQSCVDTDADESNCGTCGVKCRVGRPCQGGHCIVPDCAPALATSIPYTADRFPQFLALGDVNGDKAIDVVVADWIANVSVLLGNGDGTLRPQQTSPIAPLNDVAIGDLNGDGKPDLAVSSYENITATVDVLLGNGDGTFQAPVTYPAGSCYGPLAIGDVNNDGWLDVVTLGADHTSGIAGVLLGSGDGTLRPITTSAMPPTEYQYGFALSDVNGDTHLDLVAGDPNGAGLSVLLGNGDGTFAPATSLSSAHGVTFLWQYVMNNVVASDLNHDGVPDIVFVSNIGPSVDDGSVVRVWLGVGDGTFLPPSVVAVGAVSGSVDVGDVNGDGDPDLVVNVAGNDTITVLLGRGDGTFQSQGDFAAAGWANMLRVADMNGDGRSDVVVVSYDSGAIGVFLSTCAP